MKHCPHCGEKLAAPSVVPVKPPVNKIVKPYEPGDQAVFDRLRPKLVDMAKKIEDMTEDQWGDWLNGLPLDEFLEFISIGEDGMRSALAGTA